MMATSGCGIFFMMFVEAEISDEQMKDAVGRCWYKNGSFLHVGRENPFYKGQVNYELKPITESIDVFVYLAQYTCEDNTQCTKSYTCQGTFVALEGSDGALALIDIHGLYNQ